MDPSAPSPPSNTTPLSADTTPALADRLFVPVVTEVNERVREVFAAQEALSEQLAAMTALLERFLSESPQAPNLSDKVARLLEAKDRMARVNVTLDKIQARLTRLEAEHGAREQPLQRIDPSK